MTMIRFEQVVKTYGGGDRAVDDLSFEAPTGKITVLVGPSGCGKTTSLRMINRMIEPTSGHIYIDDEDVQAVNAAKLRRGIGYVISTPGSSPTRGWSTTSPPCRSCSGHRSSRPASGLAKCSNSWDCQEISPTGGRRSCPEDNSSGSAWHVRWPPIRR